MTDILNADLLEATRLTNAGRLTEATAALQRMLGAGYAKLGATTSATRHAPPTIDDMAAPAALAGCPLAQQPWVRSAVPEVLRGFLDQVRRGGLQLPGGAPDGLSPAAPRVPVPD